MMRIFGVSRVLFYDLLNWLLIVVIKINEITLFPSAAAAAATMRFTAWIKIHIDYFSAFYYQQTFSLDFYYTFFQMAFMMSWFSSQIAVALTVKFFFIIIIVLMIIACVIFMRWFLIVFFIYINCTIKQFYFNDYGHIKRELD